MSERDKLYEKFGKSAPKGTVIFSEGESGHEMYVIHEGKVKITKKIRAMETILAELDRGDFFGEMAILEKEVRSATATAATDVKLLVIDEKTFETTIRTNPGRGHPDHAQVSRAGCGTRITESRTSSSRIPPVKWWT